MLFTLHRIENVMGIQNSSDGVFQVSTQRLSQHDENLLTAQRLL
jgi:hypothetical protein